MYEKMKEEGARLRAMIWLKQGAFGREGHLAPSNF